MSGSDISTNLAIGILAPASSVQGTERDSARHDPQSQSGRGHPPEQSNHERHRHQDQDQEQENTPSESSDLPVHRIDHLA